MSGRLPEPNEVALVAELERARSALVRTEQEAATAIGNARGKVGMAQAALDIFRRDLVERHVAAWRAHAEDVRRRAAESGDETVVTTVVVQGGLDGDRTEPRLAFVRNILGDEAAAAERYADWLQGYLARGENLTSQDLGTLVGQLEPLPEAELVGAEG
jgi:hypothetical protein